MKTLLILAVLAATVLPAAAQNVPIMAGGNLEPSPCGSSATIRVNTFVSVRTGPGVRYPETDRVFDAQQVIICDEHGDWYGVVYIRGKDLESNVDACFGADNLWNKRRPYTGPCQHGWITKHYLANLAG
jgi:hypothetical protein